MNKKSNKKDNIVKIENKQATASYKKRGYKMHKKNTITKYTKHKRFSKNNYENQNQ